MLLYIDQSLDANTTSLAFAVLCLLLPALRFRIASPPGKGSTTISLSPPSHLRDSDARYRHSFELEAGKIGAEHHLVLTCAVIGASIS